MLEITAGAIKRGQSRTHGNIGYTRRRKKKTQHNMCWTPLCANIQTYTNNVNKTYSLLQITGSKDEPNIACARIS